MFIVVGLGNKGEEYARTRHNVGFMALELLAGTHDFPEFSLSKPHEALISRGAIDGEDVTLVLPQTYMNKSGRSLTKLISSAKKAEKLIVIYDEIDLPLGTMKFAYGRGSGGHKGVESIIRAVKTKDFIRIRVGITPTTPGGKLKKPKGDADAIPNFLLGNFKPSEMVLLKKVLKRAGEATEAVIKEGLPIAMNQFN